MPQIQKLVHVDPAMPHRTRQSTAAAAATRAAKAAAAKAADKAAPGRTEAPAAPDVVMSASDSSPKIAAAAAPAPAAPSKPAAAPKVAVKKEKTTVKTEPEQVVEHAMPDPDNCPVFLRKTYHMIDTCDPAIGGWSSDGRTFVVKDTVTFASTIIPQFFKHSKWSSFVRQLNFYGFRKIKYVDTIRLDVKLEQETANYWRFRHDKFQRGRLDLLIEIKRHINSSHTSTQAAAGAGSSAATATGTAGGAGGDASSSSNGSAAKKKVGGARTNNNAATKSEVRELRNRITAMSKNIDDLTTMVQNIQVKEGEEVGTKRKKVHDAISTSGADADDMVVDEVTSSGEEISFTPTNVFPEAVPPSRQPAITASATSDDFVDDLFNFNEDGLLDLTHDDPTLGFGGDAGTGQVPTKSMPEPEIVSSSAFTPLTPSPVVSPTPAAEEREQDQTMDTSSSRGSSDEVQGNLPDPKLMKKLTEALTLLPKSMQEMLVNRMIDNIVGTGTDSLHATAAAAAASSSSSTVVVENDEAIISSSSMRATSPTMTTRRQAAVATSSMASQEQERTQPKSSTVVVAASPDNKPEIALQLDGETLNALLAQYMEAKEKEAAAKSATGTKVLPPIVAAH